MFGKIRSSLDTGEFYTKPTTTYYFIKRVKAKFMMYSGLLLLIYYFIYRTLALYFLLAF